APGAGIPHPRRARPPGAGGRRRARRPDGRAAERRLAAADARRALAEAELYPRISFAVGAETSAATLAGLGGSGALAYAAGPLLSWRFPTRESARGRLDSAAAERDAALARFDGAVLGALREVERALALYAGERQRRADLQRALDEQRHAYRLARSNYRAGALDALELLDSQRSLVADRARLVDAEMRVAERQVELFRALGGGWQAAPSPSHQENGQ
ncbi:TolC family protein, partial [Pseudomonas aeruginosa]|nr:TolC family protein [Pseudomonas aeruginosa]